jgi:hypothetical protein
VKDLATPSLPLLPGRRPGRPAKPDAMTTAERSMAYRDRQKASGLVAVKCYLAPDAMAYLGALCAIHRITLSEAVALALAAALRGEPLPAR